MKAENTSNYEGERKCDTCNKMVKEAAFKRHQRNCGKSVDCECGANVSVSYIAQHKKNYCHVHSKKYKGGGKNKAKTKITNKGRDKTEDDGNAAKGTRRRSKRIKSKKETKIMEAASKEEIGASSDIVELKINENEDEKKKEQEHDKSDDESVNQ